MTTAKEIKSVNKAIEYLREKAGIDTKIVNYKYRVSCEDFNVSIKTDKELIDYANEQREAIEDSD